MMMEKLTSKPLKKGVIVDAQLYKASVTIQISNMTKHYEEEFMNMYFENPKSGGGPGKVSDVEMLGNGEATVTFQNPQGIKLKTASQIIMFLECLKDIKLQSQYIYINNHKHNIYLLFNNFSATKRNTRELQHVPTQAFSTQLCTLGVGHSVRCMSLYARCTSFFLQ